jgi:integrase/recombinase XerD
MLYYSGCRITEALEVTYSRIDYKRGGVVVKTLKRQKQTFRFIPLPYPFLEKLDDVHHVQDVAKKYPDKCIWSFTRKTGYNAIKSVMDNAGIEGAQATAHGLRHSFVIAHQAIKTPPHMIQQWLGWASTEMLGVYGRAMGAEERNLAAQLWEK